MTLTISEDFMKLLAEDVVREGACRDQGNYQKKVSSRIQYTEGRNA